MRVVALGDKRRLASGVGVFEKRSGYKRRDNESGCTW